MKIEEFQEYYDLIEEEIQFIPEKRQKWLLTFEERHTFGSDIVFHVYAEKGETHLRAHEIVTVTQLDFENRYYKLTETMAGNFRILLSTLLRELPSEVEGDTYGRDGSRFKLRLATGQDEKVYEWELPTRNFERIQPVLKLIWGIDQWRRGAEAMGWSAKEVRGNKSRLEGPGKSRDWKEKGEERTKKSSSKGRLDPFGSIWNPSN